jgi:hypothetical protein
MGLVLAIVNGQTTYYNYQRLFINARSRSAEDGKQ